MRAIVVEEFGPAEVLRSATCRTPFLAAATC